MELTLTQLRTMLDHAQDLLADRCGYDSVQSAEIVVQRDCMILNVYCMDDAQRDESYTDRYEVGHMLFYFTSSEELWAAIRAKPTREMRELHVLLRITAALGQSTQHIKSAQAQAFAREIIAAGEKYQNLLTK